MKEKNNSFGLLILAVFTPWFILGAAASLFGKYRDNIQVPFDFAIKYGLIAGVILLIFAFIAYLMSIEKKHLKVWARIFIKMSLVTFVFVGLVYWMRPEYTSVISRYPY